MQIEEVPVPEPGPNEVLIKVRATGMCRSDYQLIDGYFPLDLEFPYIPGHEVAGEVAQLGADVLASAGLSEGDLVVVDPAWGDGTCRQCHEGNEQLCTGSGGWIGFGPPGGFAEYVVVPSRHLIRIDPETKLAPQYLAPLVDAGLTPYRAMKKLRAAGRLGPGRNVVVSGIGGLGGYGVQYARLLGDGATVVAFARSAAPFCFATASLSYSGAPQSLELNASLLASEGALVPVGLMGRRVEFPLFLFVSGERTFAGSFWGNYNDLTEVLVLAGRLAACRCIPCMRCGPIARRMRSREAPAAGIFST